MNCCGNNNENKGKNNHSEYNRESHGIKHVLMMLLCCGLPIMLLLILPVLGVFGAGFKSSIASVIPYLCPLMMIFMIPMMLKSSKEGKSCCDKEESNSENDKK